MGTVCRGVRFALGLAALASLLGCPKVPRGAVLLSEELAGMIESARRAHLEAVDLYMSDRRVAVDAYMEQVWIPAYLANYVPESRILDSLGRAPTAARKGELMIQFATAGLNHIAATRNDAMATLAEIERLLRRTIETHYEAMRVVNQALTAHLKSAADVTEMREDLLKRLGLDVDQLLPLDAINQHLERITEAGEKAEGMVSRADSARHRIRELLRAKR